MSRRPWLAAARIFLEETKRYTALGPPVIGSDGRLDDASRTAYSVYFRLCDARMREETGWTFQEYRNYAMPPEDSEAFTTLTQSILDKPVQ